MKTKLVSILLFLSSLTAFGANNADEYKLGNGAVILETQEIKPNRTLLLWMVRPVKHPRETPSEPYSCPEYTRGNFYSGPTRVSLVDPQAHKVINTIKISSGSDGAGDKFDLSYEIRSDYYYHVEGVAKEAEGKPTIMWLKDYNGDGKSWEFALFNAEACMGLATTLIGYSERQDKVIQYQTHLTVTNSKGKRSTRTERWMDYLFSKEAQSPGNWKYEVDYQGRGGTLDKYEIQYDSKAERFEGKLTESGEE